MENSPRARLGSRPTLEGECAAGCLSVALLLGPNPKRVKLPERGRKYLFLWSQWMLQMPAK